MEPAMDRTFEVLREGLIPDMQGETRQVAKGAPESGPDVIREMGQGGMRQIPEQGQPARKQPDHLRQCLECHPWSGLDGDPGIQLAGGDPSHEG